MAVIAYVYTPHICTHLHTHNTHSHTHTHTHTQGELVLNSQTKVSSLEDKGNRHNMFLVTCGATEKPFTISADDQKMKHDWMLAIRKVGAVGGRG